MKNLADLLQQGDSIFQTSAASLASSPAAALALDPDEEMLSRIFLSLQRAGAAAPPPSPWAPDLILKVSALGLGFAVVVTGGLVAYWNRPVEALASAQTLEQLSRALLDSQRQTEALAVAANPPQYKCNALFGGCHFPDGDRSVAATSVTNLPRPVAYSAPSEADVLWAKQAIATWSSQGYDPSDIRRFVESLQQQPDPAYPRHEALTVAYHQIYGGR